MTFRLFTAFGLVVAALVGSPASAQQVDLPVPNIRQETEVWCWAAVSQQIIVATHGPEATPRQCALVAMANGAAPGACCDGYNPSCVRTGSLDQIRGLIAQFGQRATAIAPPTSPDVLFRTLVSGSPIILEIASSSTTTHVVVLRGMYFEQGPLGSRAILHVNDPMEFYSEAVPFEAIARVWIRAIVVAPMSSAY